MRYVAAYLLAVLGGKTSPTDKDITKILSSVGIDADNDSVQRVIKELSGKEIEEVIAEGQEKLASVPSGAGVAAGGGGGAAPAAAEEKKEEAKKEESEEESDDDMGFGLFD